MRAAAGDRDNQGDPSYRQPADGNGNRQPVDPRSAPITLSQALELEQQSVGLTATLATLVQAQLDSSRLMALTGQEDTP